MATIMAQEQVYGVIPAFLAIGVKRYYGGKIYERTSSIFGEKEVVTATAAVFTLGDIPLQNVDVDVLLDGQKIATVKTNWIGMAQYVFNQGIPKGTHTVRMWFRGNFWYGEAYQDQAISTVSMTQANFIVYVESLAVSVDEAYAGIIDQTLAKGTVGIEMISATVDQVRVLYKFNAWIADVSTTQAMDITVILILILAIIALIVAPSILQFIATYVIGEWFCPICGEKFYTCDSLAAHIASAHPDVWASIKDKWTCELPAGPFDWVKWLAIGGIGVVGGLVIYEVVKKV